MPRSLRILPGGSVVHALNRGNDRKALFERPEDFEDFLELVRIAKSKCTIRLLAYCLMPNHWHFVLWPRVDDDVTRFFAALTTLHAMQRRWRTGTIGYGHVYQNRYKAFWIDTDNYYFSAMSYVEGNAYRARLTERAQDWPWSSLHERNGNPRELVDPGPMPLPPDWTEQVNQPLPETTIEQIRELVRKH